ncbi:MAG: preprotein translocase subunit SecE [Candidatus Roizmanbacteria bacterium]|nr:preprotein translocase subunit SecE [Candidatus Roizmanbacteria bacterium]
MADKAINPNIFKGIISELKKVTWPSRKETLHLSLVVVIISVLLGFYIGFFDYIFAKLVAFLISLKK